MIDLLLLQQVCPGPAPTPVQQLWSAVLHRSLQDLDPRKLYASPANTGALAAQWFQSDDEQPGSFLWICLHLGLDPATIRSRLPQEKIRASRLRYQGKLRDKCCD